MGKKFNFVLGAFLGAAAGAAAGIMLAPRAGAESRAMAADAMNDAWDTAVDGYERGTKTVADKVAEVAAASGISSDELREKVDAAADANGTPAEAVRVEVVEDTPAETDAE